MGADDEKMKFSVMPSTWFRNLKKYAKQNTTTNTNTKNNTTSNTITNNAPLATQTHNSSSKLMNQPRKSYHITRDLAQASPVKNTKTETPPVELPRKSLRRRSTKKNRPLPNRPNLPKKLASPSSSSVSACRSNSPDFTEHDRTSSSELDSILNEYGSTPDMFDDSCKCRITKTNQFHPELAPIITKNRNHAINVDRTTTVNVVQEDSSPPTRRISTSSTPSGFKLRTNSPRIVNRRINQAAGRKSELSRRGVYESFAVVKTSKNPKKDFRESMVEMIVENNIMGSSKDLEDLLACYLSLNSQEYHDTIINVFKQIWFDYLHVTLK